MSIIINIALATMCFTYQGVDECHPVLLGKNTPTPVGEFTLIQRRTSDPGYGGDVLQFHETKDVVYAIHRPWLLRPEQNRLERLRSNDVNKRFVTGGCVNVETAVYEKLLDCCSNSELIIK
jgi:hypothetical protein